MNDAPKFATPIPQHYAQAFKEVAQWPPELRPGRINALTDQLVALGHARPRTDASCPWRPLVIPVFLHSRGLQ